MAGVYLKVVGLDLKHAKLLCLHTWRNTIVQGFKKFYLILFTNDSLLTYTNNFVLS